jgi:hypothetical protein
VFTKTDRIQIRGTDPAQLMQQLQGTLQAQGYVPGPPAPAGFTAVGPPLGNGVIPKVTVNAYPAGDGHIVDVLVKGDLDQSQLVIMVVCIFFFWPISAFLLWQAYNTFEQQGPHILGALRQPLLPHSANMPAQAAWPPQ